MLYTDVLIIGAGPAGASLAYQLQKSNIKTILVDRAEFPRDKLCAGGLTFKSIELYWEIYGESMTAFTSQSKSIEIYSSDSHKMGASDSLTYPLTFVNRKDFDNMLVQKYIDAGGTFLPGHTIDTIYEKQRHITFKNGETVSYTSLVGADGAMSQIRREIFGEDIKLALCFEEPILPSKTVQIYLSYYKNAYAWKFPSNIGIGGYTKDKEETRALIDTFDQFVLDQKGSKRTTTHGAFLPYGDYVKKPAKRDVYLIGDAAGFVDPLTGEGLYFAFLSAKLLAKAFLARRTSTEDAYLSAVSTQIQQVITNTVIFKKVFLHPVLFKLFRNRNKFVKFVMDNLISRYTMSYKKLVWLGLRHLKN